MSYYQGDYYEGDYYEGDPGLFSSIGRLFRKAAPQALAVIPGGGSLARVISAAGAMTRRAGGAIARRPAVAAAGAAAIAGGAGALMRRPGAAMVGPMPMGPRGFHMSKARRINPASGVPHLVRNRRMRVTNPRALRRAIRRAHGFARLARKVLRFTSPKAPRGRALFRARRRKKV